MDMDFNDKYFPRVDLAGKTIVKKGRYTFTYEPSRSVVLWIFQDDEEVEALGKANAPWRQMDAVGLRAENWKRKAVRDEYLASWIDDLDEESAYLMADAEKEFGTKFQGEE